MFNPSRPRLCKKGFALRRVLRGTFARRSLLGLKLTPIPFNSVQARLSANYRSQQAAWPRHHREADTRGGNCTN